MRETVDKVWAQIREFLGKMPRKNRIQMAILLVVVIALAIVMISILTRTNYAVLTNAEDMAAAGQIYERLVEMNVPAQVEGTTIRVPEERVGELRVTLANEGLLGSADFNRDLYMTTASGFGVTSDHAKRLYDAQLGADIKLLILQSNRIQNANVLVSSGETSPFRIQTNARRATASVMLNIRGGGRLTDAEAQTIGDIVKNSIPGIEYEDISISDSEFNNYRVGDQSQNLDTEVDKRAALQDVLTGQLKTQVEQLLTPIYGIANLQIQPNIKLNFDKVVTEEVEFEPPVAGEMEGIARSTEEIYEFSRRWADAEGIPGTDSNAMGTVEYPWGDIDERDEYRRAAISKNLEINETRRLIEHEQGAVESLSIAVLINSEAEGVEGDYSAEVADLVAKAIGVAPGHISVQQIPFAYEDTRVADMYARWEEEEAARRSRELFETILMYSVILLLGVMLILLVRTIFLSLKPPPEPEPLLVGAGADGMDFMVGDEDLEENELEDINLQTKSSGLEQIERFIDKDGAAVAQLLRNWLTDD